MSDAVADLKSMTRHFAGDEDVLADVIENFLKMEPSLFKELKTTLSSGDAKKFTRQVHTFKGLIANFFASELRERLQRIEDRARAGDLRDAGPMLVALEPDLEKLLRELSAYLPSLRRAA